MYKAFARYYDELGWARFSEGFVEVLASFLEEKRWQPDTVLDVACGTGILLKGLKERFPDLSLWGVDLSEDMLKVARSKFADGDEVRLVHADMTGFSLAQTFDLVTCTYDALNHLLEPEQVRAAFHSVARHLEEGGWYIFDVNTDVGLRKWNFIFQRQVKGNTVTQKGIYDPERKQGVTSVEAVVRDPGTGTLETFKEVFWERAYPVHTLADWLEEAGMPARHYRNYKGEELEEPETENRVFIYAQRVK